MSEAAIKQPATAAVKKDEYGVDIVTSVWSPERNAFVNYETWMFIDTASMAREGFYARFRRLVSVNGIHYAEVDHAKYANQTTRKIRWITLNEFAALVKCQAGDDVHCLWIDGKPYIFAQNGSGSGRLLSGEQWTEIFPRYYAPEHYRQIVED